MTYPATSNVLRSFSYSDPGRLELTIAGVQPAKLLVVTDPHCNFDDDRGIPYQQYSARMNRCSVHRFNLVEDAIAKAEQEGYDALLMPGDFLSFPSAAGVEKFAECFEHANVPCLFTAGNHDWHFEGMSGSEMDLRREWINKLLLPLYGGRDPMAYAIRIKDMKILMIDNSIYEILPEQLDFLEQELAEGLPVIIGCHVPLYVPGRNIFFGCGHPDWNGANDPYFEIERRERWRAEGHTEVTMKFYRTVMESPLIAGIIAGHMHRFSMDFYAGKIQAVAANDRLLDVVIRASAE